MKKIAIIGTGMDGVNTITAAALKAIDNAEVIIGAERIIKPFENMGKKQFISYKSNEISDFIKKSEYKKIAVLMSGDCGFYSGANTLLPLLSGYETEVICGISSPVYLCSRIGIQWQYMKFVSLHGTDGNIARNAAANKYAFFLLGGNITAKDVCKCFCEYGLSSIKVHIGENLGYKNERIISGNAADFTDTDFELLSVLIAVNPDYEKYIKSGIPDSDFTRNDKIPMTKSEVRSVCVSKLCIGEKSICWDIGGGTGSVSVEMAMRCSDGKVYSIEKNPDAAKIIDINRHKFHCDNIEIIIGNAENKIQNLPVPDCVFIGGANGKIEEIIDIIYDKNPGVKIVLTAVSLETLNKSISAFDKHNIGTEITQIAVTRTKKAGSHTMLTAENPVFIIKGEAK